MRIIEITEDASGCSHFSDVELELAESAYAPPAPPLRTSAPFPGATGVFFTMPAGWSGDWHPSPCRQLYVQTTGELEVEVGDGEVRRLQPGDVVLVADVAGRGHRTTVVGDADVRGVFLQLER